MKVIIKVWYEDEDGLDFAEFTNEKEADDWIDANLSRVSSGEKFKFIKKEKINNFSIKNRVIKYFASKEQEELKKHQDQYGPKSQLSGPERIKRNKLLDAARLKSHEIENTIIEME